MLTTQHIAILWIGNPYYATINEGLPVAVLRTCSGEDLVWSYHLQCTPATAYK